MTNFSVRGGGSVSVYHEILNTSEEVESDKLRRSIADRGKIDDKNYKKIAK